MDRYQKQRFELKYQIPQHAMAPIRQFVSSYLDLDPYAGRQPDLAYAIHSLYLDSPDLRLFQSTVNGDRNRYKLRVRYYSQQPGAPVFVEIKSRRDNVILKCRTMVRRDAMAALLAGRQPSPDDLHAADPADLEALVRFCSTSRAIAAGPKARICYRREAWLSTDNSVRVTMDRDVCIAPDLEGNLNADATSSRAVFGNRVVLEIKFTDRYPIWLTEMVRAFGLRQGSAAKYVDGVIELGEHMLLSGAGRTEIRRRLAMRQAG